MSDPKFIEMLNREYLALVEHYVHPQTMQEQIVEEPAAPGDVSGLKIIVDAEELFAQIQPQLQASNFFLMVMVGQQGSGKSVAARELAHMAHLNGYKILYASAFDLAEAPEKFKEMAGGAKKVALILDDMSFVVGSLSSRQANKVKNYFGLIRHALEDAQVLMIPIIHTMNALPPIFKNTNVWLLSKPTMLEYDGMLKVVGRNKKSRDAFDKMFQSIVQIQSAASKSKDIPLNLYGRNYIFRWGDRTDPGDGRLLLLLLSGEPLVYNSQNTYCEECKHVAFGVKVRKEDYITKRPSEENYAENEKSQNESKEGEQNA